MTNADFLHLLVNFTIDRFALSGLNTQEFGQFYYRLIGEFGCTAPAWYLIGTDGCHLCEQAQDMLRIVRPDTSVITLDVIEASDTVITALALHLPVLLTPQTIIAYPFGIMDVVALT